MALEKHNAYHSRCWQLMPTARQWQERLCFFFFLTKHKLDTMLRSADKNLRRINEFGLQLFLVPVVLDYHHFFHKKMEKKGKWFVEITLTKYQSGKSVKYDIQLMFLFELKLVEKSRILLWRHFKLDWNITAFI